MAQILPLRKAALDDELVSSPDGAAWLAPELGVDMAEVGAG
jgi:hypothetical protein